MDEPRPRDRSEEKAADDVRQFGWHVVMIPEKDGTPGWAFTVGLMKTFGHPEVVVFGLDQEVAHLVLNDVSARVRDGLKIVDGTRADELLEAIGLGVLLDGISYGSRSDYASSIGEAIGFVLITAVLFWIRRTVGAMKDPGDASDR